METNETTGQTAPETGMALTFEGQTYLREAGKWAGFLGIIGFVMCGLLLIAALFVGTIFSMLAQISPVYAQMPAGIGAVFAVILILIDVLYFFFALYLYQFSARIKKGIVFTDQFHVTQALSKLKSFFKLAGIVTIVALCLYALEIVAAIVVGIAAAHH
jgi:hypothetical protein